jgi:hypothetical protein
MNMIRCPLLSILRTPKTSDGLLGFGEDLRSFAISDIVGSDDVSGAPMPPRAN